MGNGNWEKTNPPISAQEVEDWLSPNHGGEMINVLFLDSHVEKPQEANVGVDGDNIYSCAGNEEETKTRADGQGRTGIGGWKRHIHPEDSFLVGPE